MGSKYKIKISKSGDKIYLWIENFKASAITEYSDELWDILSAQNWTVQLDKKRGGAKYLYSNKIKKTLHRQIMDFYFSEKEISQAIDDGMIIEHLNNDGLDCRISNLYLLSKNENTYKGQHFDKKTENFIDKFSIRIKHLFGKKAFQILIIFTEDFRCEERIDKPIDTIFLFYDRFDYSLICRDANRLIMNYEEKKYFDLKSDDYGFYTYEITYREQIIPTHEEIKNGVMAGNLRWIDGNPYLLTDDSGKVTRLDKDPIE